MNHYKQGDKRWRDEKLGFGSSTLWGGGCLLCCFAMAYEFFYEKTCTPPQANRIAKKARAFTRSRLYPELIAEALGLVIVDRIRDALPTDGRLVSLADEAIDAGGLAILTVDHDGKPGDDHFVLVRERHAMRYRAVDPVSGKLIELDPNLRGKSLWGRHWKDYEPVGVMCLGRRED